MAHKHATSTYHKVDLHVYEQEKKKPGRPSKDPEKNQTITEFKITSDVQQDDEAIEEWIRKECTFVLGSNDVSITGEPHTPHEKFGNDYF